MYYKQIIQENEDDVHLFPGLNKEKEYRDFFFLAADDRYSVDAVGNVPQSCVLEMTFIHC